MADPRTDALMRALGGAGGPMPEEQSGPEGYPEGEPDSAEQAASECLERLSPFMDDPRISKAAMALQEIAGGEPMSGDMDTDMEMAPAGQMMPGAPV